MIKLGYQWAMGLVMLGLVAPTVSFALGAKSVAKGKVISHKATAKIFNDIPMTETSRQALGTLLETDRESEQAKVVRTALYMSEKGGSDTDAMKFVIVLVGMNQTSKNSSSNRTLMDEFLENVVLPTLESGNNKAIANMKKDLKSIIEAVRRADIDMEMALADVPGLREKLKGCKGD